MMADGALNADIARELVLSPATVKTHVNHIFTKLGAKDRVQPCSAIERHSGRSGVGTRIHPRAQDRSDTTVG